MVSESRRRIEVAAAGLLARSGYHGFGLKKLSAAAGLPYGSIYHHFPGGKQEIAVAAITGTGALAGRALAGAPADVVATTSGLFEFMAAKLTSSEWAEGCPIGTPALDGGGDDEQVRAACAAAFDIMERAFSGLLVELGVPADTAADTATTVVAAYEGATLLARVRRSEAPLQVVQSAMATLVRAVVEQAPAID